MYITCIFFTECNFFLHGFASFYFISSIPRYGALSFGNVRSFVPPKYNDRVPTTYKKMAVRNAAMVRVSFHLLCSVEL